MCAGAPAPLANVRLPSWTLQVRKLIFLFDSVSIFNSGVQMQKCAAPVPSNVLPLLLWLLMGVLCIFSTARGHILALPYA